MYLPYRFPKWWICLGRLPMGPWVDQIQTSRKSQEPKPDPVPPPARVVHAETLQSFHKGGPKTWQQEDPLQNEHKEKKNAYYMRFDWKLDTQKSYHHFPYLKVCFGYRPFLDTPIMFDWLQTQVPVQLSASLRMRSRTKSTISLPIV